MARILDDLELIAKKRSGSEWELAEPLFYHVGNSESSEVIVIPAGFVTDGASTPFGIRNLLPKDGTYTPAACIHDALYRYKGILPFGWFSGLPKEYNRKCCDEIFAEAMNVLSVPVWKINTMFWALRFFGWASWNRKENKAGR